MIHQRQLEYCVGKRGVKTMKMAFTGATLSPGIFLMMFLLVYTNDLLCFSLMKMNDNDPCIVPEKMKRSREMSHGYLLLSRSPSEESPGVMVGNIVEV